MQINQCNTITEVREKIDRIDQLIIGLMGERFQLVKEIVRFKSNADEVIARQRYNEVLKVRREWAEKEGLNADIIEKIYIELMQYFIVEQMNLLKLK